DEVVVGPGGDALARVVGQVPGDRAAAGGEGLNQVGGHREDLDGRVAGQLVKSDEAARVFVRTPGVGEDSDNWDVAIDDRTRMGMGAGGAGGGRGRRLEGP